MSNPSSPGLVRVLGPWVATAIVVGTVIGSGVFKKPSSIAASVPSFDYVALVWVLGGLLALLGALALAEVAVLFPRAGGNYVFLREGYGRLMGFLWGWVDFWIIRAGSIAALATVFVQALHDILRHSQGDADTVILSSWAERYLTVGVILVLAAVNARGVRWGGGLQLLITLVKVGSLLTILVLPFFFWGAPANAELLQTPRTGAVFSWGGLGTAFLGVLWAYHGWMNITPIAGEVKNPQRNLPMALLAGVGIVIFLYVGANLAYHLVIPMDVMADPNVSSPTISVFFLRLLGSTGAILASAALMVSVFGALNGNLMVGPRTLFAMGEDRLAPAWLSAVHPRWRTPARAIGIMALWSCMLILVAAAIQASVTPLPPGAKQEDKSFLDVFREKPLFDLFTDFSMFGAVIFETLAVTTIFVFRRTMPHAERPYRCWGYPAVPLLYLILPIYILASIFISDEHRVEAIIGTAFIGLGIVVYVVFLRGRAATE